LVQKEGVKVGGRTLNRKSYGTVGEKKEQSPINRVPPMIETQKKKKTAASRLKRE